LVFPCQWSSREPWWELPGAAEGEGHAPYPMDYCSREVRRRSGERAATIQKTRSACDRTRARRT